MYTVLTLVCNKVEHLLLHSHLICQWRRPALLFHWIKFDFLLFLYTWCIFYGPSLQKYMMEILIVSVFIPLDKGCKLNVHKTFRRCPGGLLNVLNVRSIYDCVYGYVDQILQMPITHSFQKKWIYYLIKSWNLQIYYKVLHKKAATGGVL